MTIRQGLLPFEFDADATGNATAYAGLPLIVEALRAVVGRRECRRLRRALKYRTWKGARRHLETLLCLIAAGGDYIDDVDRLRADVGLQQLLGFELSSSTALKQFLYRFHQSADGEPLTSRDDAELSVAGRAQIRQEGPALQVLKDFVGAVVARMQARQPQARATLDVDATIARAHEKQALVCYEGTRGYQPQMAWWAEKKIWLEDQFRDGNVPAEFHAKQFLQQAFARLPASVIDRRLRADSALYNEAALTWADTDFIPGWSRNRRTGTEPFRYVAIRVRSRQSDLLVDDERRWRHFAVVTNMGWDGERLLRWHREKQGTVEYGHGVMKNDLAAGTLPCGRFGANAAWWRLNVLVHNLLELIRVEALPAELATARPKRLRFGVFHVAGVLVRHARRLVVRLAATAAERDMLVAARRTLLRLARDGPQPAR